MVGALTGCKKDEPATDGGNATVDEGNTGNEDEGKEGSGLDTSKTVKIGILLADSTTPESLAFQNYYKNYIGENYNVELIYSDELADAAAENRLHRLWLRPLSGYSGGLREGGGRRSAGISAGTEGGRDHPPHRLEYPQPGYRLHGGGVRGD